MADAHATPPPLSPTPPPPPPPRPQHPTQNSIPVYSSTSHLHRPSSTSLDVPSPYELENLKAFERQEVGLRRSGLELQKLANNAMTALENSSLMILLVLLGYISLVVSQAQQGQFSCLTGFRRTIATVFSFWCCYSISLVAAVLKIKQLSHPSTQLVNRQRRHILSIEAFKDDLRGRGLLKSQSVFGRRLGALGALSVSPCDKDVSMCYREIMAWLCVAVLVALTICLMAGVLFCNGDGGSLEMRYTY